MYKPSEVHPNQTRVLQKTKLWGCAILKRSKGRTGLDRITEKGREGKD